MKCMSDGCKEKHIPWRLVTSSTNYAHQMRMLLREPVFHGSEVPRGNGEPILLILGFLAGDWSLKVLTGWLKRIGYRAYRSRIDWHFRRPLKTSDMLGCGWTLL